ncbi:hypothetical protein [Halobacteriovorax sp. HLS]|uniref:hypothetical protein n=1 Tax=Halobacteriovorax sp. HLS TaxID=2234000 RepID=UPI000FDC8742|nr:hypothetical protein [Halobacteriovorax sp. HLS]
MFYIDIDMTSQKIYIFPLVQSKDHPFVISVDKRFEADIILRKLTSNQYKAPPAKSNFELLGTVQLGELIFDEYRLITR